MSAVSLSVSALSGALVLSTFSISVRYLLVHSLLRVGGLSYMEISGQSTMQVLMLNLLGGTTWLLFSLALEYFCTSSQLQLHI